MKPGDLVQNRHNPITNKEAGEEVGVVTEFNPSGNQFKIILLGETRPHLHWRMVKTYEVLNEAR